MQAGRKWRVMTSDMAAPRPEHLCGIIALRGPALAVVPDTPPPSSPQELLRPLADYEQAAGGAW